MLSRSVFYAFVVACALAVQGAFAANTITAAFQGPGPSGPNQGFVIDLQLSGDPIEVDNYGFRMYYDNTKMQIPSIAGIDNTGQPAAGFTVQIDSYETFDLSIPGFNAYKVIQGYCTAGGPLLNPGHIGAIPATTTSTYGPVHVKLVKSPDPTDFHGLYYDSGFTVEYPCTFVDGCPVSLSGFSAE